MDLGFDMIDRKVSLPIGIHSLPEEAVDTGEPEIVPQPRLEIGVVRVTPGAMASNVRGLWIREQRFRGQGHDCSSSTSSFSANACNSSSTWLGTGRTV